MFALLAIAALCAPPHRTPAAEPTPVLIISGANNHDWEWTTPSLKRILEADGLFSAEITYDPATTLAAGGLEKYAAFVLDYNGPRWGETAEVAFIEAVRTGTGVVVIHAANNAFPGFSAYEQMVGDLWRDGTGHGRFHPFDVTILDREHPITRGSFDLRAHPDELYHDLVRTPGKERRVLATAWSSKASGGTGEAEPMITVGTWGKGRVFHTPLGHVWRGNEASRASHTDPQFQKLVRRGTEWAASGRVSDQGSARNRLSPVEQAQGWKLLFDGTSSEGWRGYKAEHFPEQGWKIEDGTLICLAAAGGGDIVTSAQYADFELEFDWRVTAKANSGVIYRVNEEGSATYVSGPEYQVIDDGYFDEPSPMQSAAALYALAAAEGTKPMPVGRFNRGKIVVRGWNVEHWLNGERILTCDLAGEDGRARIAASKFAEMPLFAKFLRGHIALQDHGNEVGYCNLKLRELAPQD
jgi:type 1 glutamine amidotransferase